MPKPRSKTVDAPEFFAFMTATRHLPVLPGGETETLIRARQAGDDAAAKKLLAHNHGLIARYVWRYWPHARIQGLTLDDVFCAAVTGFRRAIVKFDFTKKTKLSTYAAWWMRAVIKRTNLFGADGGNMPLKALQDLSVVERFITAYGNQHDGREPTVTEIAEKKKLTPQMVTALLRTSRRHLPLEVACNDNGTDDQSSGETRLTQVRGELPDGETVLLDAELRSRVQKVLGLLSERERMIVHFRLIQELTKKETALRINVVEKRPKPLSQERIRQVQEKVEIKLRAALEPLLTEAA